jgi:hypothetical protein
MKGVLSLEDYRVSIVPLVVEEELEGARKYHN